MEPIPSIVMALALGAAAGLKPVAEQAIKEGYAALKALITRKYAQVNLDQLEVDPASKNRQGVMEEELASAGVDQDAEVLHLAEALLESIRRLAPETAAGIGVDQDSQGVALVIRHASTTVYTRTIRKLIGWGGTALGLLFTWIQLRNFPVDILTSSTTPILLWHGGLTLYYLSWVFGTKFDIDAQELVYVVFPEQGKVPVHGFMVVIVLIVIGAVLLWTERDIQRFVIAIDIFIVVDHLAWRYLIWLLRKVVRDSQTLLRQDKDYFSLEKLNTVSYQIQGNWKWWRLTATMPIIILLNAFAFSGTVHSYLTTTTVSLLPSFSNQDASAFVSGILLLGFVLIAEIWHWVLRIKTKVSLDLIEKLRDKYKLYSSNNPWFISS